MPLTSSRLSKPSEPSTPAPAAASPQQNVSPRRRGGLTPAAAGASAAVAPRTDALDAEAQVQDAVQDPPGEGEQTPPAETTNTPSTAPAPAPKVGRPAGARDRAPRVPRTPVELPEDAANSDDPVILRRVLTSLDQEARELKAKYDARIREIDAEFTPQRDALRAKYKAVSNKLANVMI